MRDAGTTRTHAALQVLGRPVVSAALLALALTALLYGEALALPLFSDDLVQIPWLESISWGELWSGPSPYGYYRPLWYSLWRLWGGLLGGLQPAGLHLLNLIFHFSASALVGTLAARWAGRDARLARRRAAALLATALFVAFPFARQAVAWPGAVYNPIVSALAAAAVLTYDRGRSSGNVRYVALAATLCVLAAFHYEAGLLTAPLVLLVEVVGRASRWWHQRRRWWPLVFLAVFISTFVVWQTMRQPATATFGLHAEDLRRNVGFLLQGLIYPAAPLAQALASWTGLGGEVCLWLVGLPVLGTLLWRGLRSRKDLLLLGLGWFALFALPPLVSMEADWFELAPRFLYTTAPGVALIWAAGVVPALSRLPARWQRMLASALAVLLLLPAAVFVRDGVALYGMAGEAIWDAARAVSEDRPLLLVNLPMRVTPRDRLYPLGFEGITPLPQRVTGAELLYVHTGIADAAEAVSFGAVATDDPAAYTYQLLGPSLAWDELVAAVRQGSAVYLTEYEGGRIHLLDAGGLVDQPPSPETIAVFGNKVALLAAEASCDEHGHLQLSAVWRAEGPIETDVTIFAHLLNETGVLQTQADGSPLLGMLPFRLWQSGEVMRDVHHFGRLLRGQYEIRLGLWEPMTGERWAAAGHKNGFVVLQASCAPGDY